MATSIHKEVIGEFTFEILSHGTGTQLKFFLYQSPSNNPIMQHDNYGYVKKYLDGFRDGYSFGVISK